MITLHFYIHDLSYLSEKKSKIVPPNFSSINEQTFLRLTDIFHSHPFLLGQGTVWYGNIVSGSLDFIHQLFFILGHHGSWFHPGLHTWMGSHVVHATKRVTVCVSSTGGGGKVHGGFSGFPLQPILVSAGQGKIRPPKELAFLLGTTQVQPVRILVRATLLQRGRFATETQQVLPHLEDV